MISYGVARFVIEFFRGDPDRGFVLGGALSTSQAIAAVMVPLGMGILVWAQKRQGTARRAQGTGKKP
jgi:phosphatidylglycerol---prolipoprotein diacylglyceryl transferase